MNKIILSGRLTKDPTVKGNTENRICRFNISVKRDNKNEYDFFNCFIIGKEITSSIEKNLYKGSNILIEGSARLNKTGKNYVNEIEVKHIEYISNYGPKKNEIINSEDIEKESGDDKKEEVQKEKKEKKEKKEYKEYKDF